MAFLDELAVVINAAGCGTVDVDLFISSKATLPAGNGPYTHLREFGGSGVDYIHNEVLPAYEYPAAMIVVHSLRYQDAHARARQVWNALCAVKNQDVSGTGYIRIRPLDNFSDVLGLDDKNRAQCSFNVIADKRPS